MARGVTSIRLLVNANDAERNQLVEAAVKHLVAESLSKEKPAEGAEGVSASVSPASVSIVNVAVPQVRYFDVVLLGLVGMGIMSNSIISIAVRISTYRGQAGNNNPAGEDRQLGPYLPQGGVTDPHRSHAREHRSQGQRLGQVGQQPGQRGGTPGRPHPAGAESPPR